MKSSARELLLVLISMCWSTPAQVTNASAGGPPGGAIEAIVFDPKDATVIYAATDWSGIFKSTDSGESWTAMNTGVTNSAVYSLAISPSSPATLYAGTNTGVFKSIDGGRQWASFSTGLPKGFPASMIEMLAIDPLDPQTLYAGTFDQIFKTVDGGKNWIRAASHPNITQTSHFSALAVDPSHPASVYAAAKDSGLLKSDDGGKNWKSTTGTAIDRVLVDPSNSAVILASDGGEILKSPDAGKHWSRVKSLLQTYQLFALEISRTDPGTVYVGSFEGRVFKSSNKGETWLEVGTPSASEIKVLATHPVDPDTLFAGTVGGIYKSNDGGTSWRPVNSGITNSNISVISIAPSNSGLLYVGTYRGGIAKSANGGESWTPINAGLTTDDVFALAVDPFDASKVYAGTYQGIFRSTNGGATWSRVNYTPPESAICSLIVDGSDPAVLYATTLSGGKAFKSTNGGESWTGIEFGFPRVGGCGMVMSPADSAVLWAKSSVGTLKSADAGKTWQKDSSDAFARLWLDSTSLATDPANRNTLYAASSASVFTSPDRGKTWQRISTTSPTQGMTHLLLDPKNPSIIYAEAELREKNLRGTTIFKSTDGGQSWKPANTGLPDASVRALVIDPTDSSTLYVGTFKRGVFKSTNGGESWRPTGSTE